jgi:hypothetical protein
VTREELVGKIEELANVPPRNRQEIAARLHALARIDLRDQGEASLGAQTNVGGEVPHDSGR